MSITFIIYIYIYYLYLYYYDGMIFIIYIYIIYDDYERKMNERDMSERYERYLYLYFYIYYLLTLKPSRY
jgi:hypothetical protein